MARIPKKQRLLGLEQVVNRMAFDDVVTLVCVSEGINVEQLEREGGIFMLSTEISCNRIVDNHPEWREE